MAATESHGITTVRNIILDGIKPPSQLPAWQWIEQNIELDNTSSIPGRVSFDLFPMSKTFFNYAQNPRTRKLTVMVSAQSTKTQNAIMFALWRVAEKPAPMIWAMAAADHCEEFGKKRLWPAVEDCPPVSALAPQDRESWTKRLIRFDSMNLMLRGSNSRIGLQSDPVGIIVCDERREWKHGAIELIRKRTRTFSDYLEISMGTAGKENDELHRDFIEGSQTFFHFTCPHCQCSQPFRFGKHETTLFEYPRDKGGLTWETNEVTRPNGNWNFAEVAKTVRYECEECGHKFKNADKAALIKTIKAVHHNPDALPSHVSLHWNALYMPWVNCDWSEIVVEFLKANHALKPEGGHDLAPMITFTTETLGEPWREIAGEKPQEGEIMNRCGEYVIGEEWKDTDNTTKILTVDNQDGYVVYVLRQWRKDGTSRLIEAGKLLSFDELRTYQIDHGVIDRAVWIDCAYKPTDVFKACMNYGRWVHGRDKEPVWDGWTPIIGDDAEEFTRIVKGVRMRVHWKKINKDPGIGTGREGARLIPRYSWSNPHYKEQLYIYRVNGKGPAWELPKNISSDYVKQMQATERVQITDATGQVTGHKWVERGRHDFGDAECFQLVVADVGGIGK